MVRVFSLIYILVFGLVSASFAGGLTIFAADHYYQKQDRFDSTRSKSEHYADLGITLTDLAGSGLSFNSDVLYTNALALLAADGITREAARQPLQITSGYLEWKNMNSSVECKLGRQLFTNCAVDAIDFDGLGIAFRPDKNNMVNVGGGLVVPTPFYTDTLPKKSLISDPKNSTLYFADYSNMSLPHTIINGTFAYEKSIHGVSAMRVAMGTRFSPVEYLRFDGFGRYSSAVNGLDHLDARVTYMPNRATDISAWFINERDRIDSLNYFSILMHENFTEVGTRIDYYLENDGCLQGGYHGVLVKNKGLDHFLMVNAASRYLDGGLTFGIGYHGMTIRPKGGFSLPVLSFFKLKGSAVYQLIEESGEEKRRSTVALTGGIKGIFPFGFTMYPRVEFVTNRYYKEDIRFLFTTSLLLHSFWESR